MKCLAVFVLFAIVATGFAQIGYGGYGGYQQGGGGGGQSYGQEHHHAEEYIDYQGHPHYQYKYGVHDGKTHDIKEQSEERDGHVTKGRYSLKQPDGRTRIVEYIADKHGVNYNIKYEGHAIHEEGHRHQEQQHHGYGGY